MSTTSTGSSSRRNAAPNAIPTRPEEIAAALERLAIRPARRWGQSFLTDPFVADAEAALAATPDPGPAIEIGGGLGLLTDALLRRGIGPLTVVERDPRLVVHLRRTFGARIEVVGADALTWPIPPGVPVVANLPFSTATPILRRLWDARVPRIVAMVQREVAERIAAGPGSKRFGRLSIAAALYGSTELFQAVPSAAFRPVPEVEGRILVHTARPGPLPVEDPAGLEAIVRTLFGSRRKKLGNLLVRLARSRADADRWAEEAGWPSDWSERRPEELAPEQYFALARAKAPRAVRTS